MGGERHVVAIEVEAVAWHVATSVADGMLSLEVVGVQPSSREVIWQGQVSGSVISAGGLVEALQRAVWPFLEVGVSSMVKAQRVKHCCVGTTVESRWNRPPCRGNTASLRQSPP